jgi:sugar/nucleoside kinase (ribokinase family)
MSGFISAVSNITVDMIYENLSRIPKLGEEVFSTGFDIQIGGGITASIIALARLGVDTRFGTFLGEDILSKFALNQLEENNVKVKNLHNKNNLSPVTVSTVITFPEDRCFLTYAPKPEIFKCSEEDMYSMLKGSSVCMAASGYDNVFSTLHKEGSKVVYDVGWSDDLSLKKIEDILKYVDVFTPNEREALKMTGADNLEEAIKTISGYVENTVITMGKEGAMTLINGKVVTVPILPVFNSVDTTGAGDNFLGGIMYGLLNKWNLVDCIKIGNILGGYSTTEFGCCKAKLTLDKAMKYMDCYTS